LAKVAVPEGTAEPEFALPSVKVAGACPEGVLESALWVEVPNARVDAGLSRNRNRQKRASNLLKSYVLLREGQSAPPSLPAHEMM
jgi:hypothetical protein